MRPGESLFDPILRLHERIREAVLGACERSEQDQLAAVTSEQPGDTIYAIDRVSEAELTKVLGSAGEPLHLMAEGLPEGGVSLPEGTREADCRWRVLVDPIDGTRGLMYQKRSAWILTAVAPNNGAGTRLRDTVFAMQTEIPTLKQRYGDQLFAYRGGPLSVGRWDRLEDRTVGVPLGGPSRAASIAHGFATIVRFFPGAAEVLGGLDDELMAAIGGKPEPGKASSFEDQYTSTGGQLYELMAGHDRFIADLRPLTQPARTAAGLPPALCCHPYDLCTALIAEAAGVVLTGADGGPLDAPFDVAADVSWVGYANAALRAGIEPVLQRVLRRRGLLPQA